MKDFKILGLLDKLKPAFTKLGVEYEIMRKILQVKLLMDGRRVPTVFAANNNKKKDDTDNGNKFVKSLWIYILMGVILIPFVVMKSNYIYQMGTVFTIIMFFIMTSLISDFSSVLLDVKDKGIIGTKPISPKTLRMAKTIHITIYMFYLTAALVGPALIVSIFTQGAVFSLLFLLLLVLVDLFIIVLTSLVYFVVLRFFDGEKLKDIINYIQIILSMVLMIGYQLVGRLFDIVDMKIEFVTRWWQYLVAPIWFAAPFQILKTAEINATYIIFAIMAILVPIIAIIVYIKLMPMFEQNLQKLTNNHRKAKKAGRKPGHLLAKLLCRSTEERIFFQFASDMMRNEREFKLKVYPSLGFSLIFPFIFIFQQLSRSSLQEVAQGSSYLFIYFSCLILPTIVMMMKYSERYKGAWIYKALPIRNVVPVFKGTIKAFLARLFIPLFLFEALIFTYIFGVRIVPDLMVVFFNTMIFNVLCFMMMEKAFPFSEAFDAAQQANAGATIALMALVGVIAAVHFGLTKINNANYVLLAISFVVNLILWSIAFRISPEKLNKQES